MDTNKNSYTIIYTIVLVAVVAAILAVVYTLLKPVQQTNIVVEKQMNILSSAFLAADAGNASDKNSYIQEQFGRFVKEGIVVNANGDVIKSDSENIAQSDAFKVSPAEQFDIMRKIASAKDEQQAQQLREQLQLPVFICDTPEGKKYILSCYGSGLWGPIWAYISVNDNLSTIYGALFDHKSETPGLGGEIVTDNFRNQFVDKVIVENGAISHIKVVKGGAKDKEHEIDALSGATITSNAVQSMISMWLEYYMPYLQKLSQTTNAQ